MRLSAPDNAFLIEEVIDHFDAITHLHLGFFGHRKDSTEELAWLHVIERRNPFRSTPFELLSVTCHVCLLFL